MKCGREQDRTIVEEIDTTILPMDEREYKRLCNRFKEWSKIDNLTIIAKFMKDELSPRQEYTKIEIVNAWKKYSKESINKLFKQKIGISNGYGCIFIKYKN